MKLTIDDSEIKELKISDVVKSNDSGIVITKNEHAVRERGEGRTEEQKEIIANTAIELGSTKAAEIHGTSQRLADGYSKGEHIKNEDARARILSKRHDIADVAVTKLMETLGLIQPDNFEKESDKVKAAAALANVVDKLSPATDRNKGDSQVQIVFYNPGQKDLREYKVIDV